MPVSRKLRITKSISSWMPAFAGMTKQMFKRVFQQPARYRLALLACLYYGPPAAAEWNARLRLTPEYHRVNEGSALFPPAEISDFAARRSLHELELDYRQGGVNGQLLLRNDARSDSPPENDVILNELYWDTRLLGQEITLGKKVMGWGVGFGFRPLDVIQQEDRRRLYPTPLEGIPLLAWQGFSATGAATLVIANPTHGEEEKPKDDASLALKLYRIAGEADLHGVARLSQRQRWELGGGFSRVMGDRFEWHGSLLYQHRYQRLINPLADNGDLLLATSDPLQIETSSHGIKALLGASWTTRSGWSMLGEAWYDEQAYTRQEWESLIALSGKQLALLGQAGLPDGAIFSNIAASSRYLQVRNLLRWNSLLRIAYEGERIKPSLDLLYTPEDNGHVLTFNLGYEHDTHRFDFALRRYGGPADAAYRQLPERWLALLAWQWGVK
jgi:hypothetical protein